jgi:hypothetical protein
MKEITKEEILQIPVLNFCFRSKFYKDYLDSFVQDINTGQHIDVYCIMHYLIKAVINYCGISLTYRTVAYDFAWAVLAANKSLWNE